MAAAPRTAGAIRALGGAGGEALGEVDDGDDSGAWGWGGGGGGGRVKVFAVASSFTGSMLATGGAGGAAPAAEDSSPGDPGSDGTVHYASAQPADFTALTCVP